MTNEAGSLEERLARLEARVAELEGRKATSPPHVPVAGPPSPQPRPAERPAVNPYALRPDEWFRRGEGWLGRIGVGLLAFGLIFLFRYAVERGWLSPTTRISIGTVSGVGFFLAGERFFRQRAVFRQLMLGGGVALLLITTLAASLLYHMITTTQALAAFTVVTVVALARASQRGDTVLASAVITAALLPSAALLQPAASPVFWYFLLVLAVLGSVAALLGADARFTVVAALATLLASAIARPLPGVHPAEVIALSATWLGFGVAPLLRRTSSVRADLEDRLRLVLPLACSVVLALLAASRVLPGAHTFEVFVGVAAVAYAGIAVWLWSGLRLEDAARIGGFGAAASSALVLGTLAAMVALWGNSALFVPAAFGVAGYAASVRFRSTPLRITAYVMLGVFAAGFAITIQWMAKQPAFDGMALSGLGGATLLAILALRIERLQERVPLWTAVFIMAHVLMATELGAVQGARWLGSAGYALAGSTLVLLGLHNEQRRLQQAGLASLALLVFRLFAFDTANAGAGVRILLFAGCGAAFLFLSYFFRARHAG